MIVHPDIIKNLGIGQCILLKQVPKGIHLINIRDREEDRIQKPLNILEKSTLNVSEDEIND